MTRDGDDRAILVTEAPVRVIDVDEGLQPLRCVLEVQGYTALDLQLRVLEGTDVEVRLLTSMQNDSDDGWIEVNRFVPTSAVSAAGNTCRRTFFPLLRYARWEMLSGFAGTFLIQGVGRRRLGFLPTDVDGGILWLRSDLSVAVASGNVTSWGDRSGKGHSATQATPTDQPAYSAAGWSNGLPTVEFDRANAEWMDLGTMSDSSNSYTMFAAVNQRNQTLHPQDLLAARVPGSSSRLFALVTDLSNGVGIYDGTWRPTGAEQNGEQLLTWVVNAAGGSVECFRNGASIGTGSYVGTWGWETPKLGRLGTSDTQHIDAGVAEVILYNRKLDASELALVHGYLKARYRL